MIHQLAQTYKARNTGSASVKLQHVNQFKKKTKFPPPIHKPNLNKRKFPK